MKIYETRSALKVFYLLVAADGCVDAEELGRWHSIGLSIDPVHFVEYSDAIENECKFLVNLSGDEQFINISKTADEALMNEAGKSDQGITPRLLIWNLFVLAFSNGVFEVSERKLIEYIADKIGVEKSILLEMGQMIKTLTSIQGEINWITNSGSPQEKIIRAIDELEGRQKVITEAAEYLIADELDVDSPYVYKPDFFDKTKSKIGTAVVPVAAKAKEKTGEVFGKLTTKIKLSKKNSDSKEEN